MRKMYLCFFCIFLFIACVDRPYIPPNMANFYKPCNSSAFICTFYHKNHDTSYLLGVFPISCSNSFINDSCNSFDIEITLYDNMHMMNQIKSCRFKIDTSNLKCCRKLCFFKVAFHAAKSLYFAHIKIINQCNNTLYWHFEPFQKRDFWRQHLLFQNQYELPIISGHVRINDTILLLVHSSLPEKLYLFKAIFTDHLPVYPFVFENYKIPNIQWNYIKAISTDTLKRGFSFEKEGLYFFSVDSAIICNKFLRGCGILVVDKVFPYVSSPHKMLEPLRYIISEYEYKMIADSENLQMQIELFWIRNSLSAEDARKKMKNFYQRVEEANALFTVDREGWKTDRGMIYIVFGQPSYVQKGIGFERWFYGSERSLFAPMFDFYEIHTLTQRSDYYLFRHPFHKKFWDNTIKQWRK